MKISKVSLFKYGKFIDKMTLKFSQNRPNVIFGKNEAGKTTLAAAIGELIFGFVRTRKDRHPYLPWNDELIRVEMEYLNRENREFLINRLLSSNAKATLVQGLEQKPMGNVPVPEADFITHNIYKNVYMITSDQLKEIENKTLGELQDKLVLNYGNSNVSPKAVIERLDEELKDLYNSRSRNNKQVMNALMSEVKELKHERKEKLDLYSQVRVMRDDIEKLETELRDLDETILERVAAKQKINRYLKPIQLLTRIDNLKSNVENYERYAGVEKDILEQYERLKKAFEVIQKQVGDKEQRIDAQNMKIATLTRDERLALGIQGQTDEIAALEDAIRETSAELERVNERIHVSRKKLDNEAAYLFEEHVEDVEPFDIQEIQSLYFKSKEEAANHSGSGLSVLRLLIVAGLLAVGIWIQNTYGLIVLGVTLLIVLFDVIERRIKSKNKSEILLKKRLAEIGVKESYVDNFTEINLRNLESMSEITSRMEDLSAAKRIAAEKVLTLKEQHVGVFEEFEEAKKLRNLREVLTQAVSKDSLNKEIKNNLEVENSEFLALNEDRMRVEHELETVKRSITKIGDGDFETGYQRIEGYLPVQDRIEHYEVELTETFNIADLKEEIQNMDRSTINEDYLNIVEGEIEELKTSREEKGKHRVQLKADIDHMIQGDTLDVIEGKIQMREEEIQEHSFQYDLMSVLNLAVKRGDERFREKNQPDVLKLAGEYFREMTCGNYTHVLIEDNDQIFIKSSNGELISADEELSAGTRNQLYLSLRLAFIGYLDRDRERLPIMMDEVFSNWDSERLEPTLALVDKIAKERQVILLTCKEENLRVYEAHLSQIQKIVIS